MKKEYAAPHAEATTITSSALLATSLPRGDSGEWSEIDSGTEPEPDDNGFVWGE